ncbi:MAG TPA: inosine/xanthosine triphosphatase [Ktedonobacteraceae bacterium]|jgi:inosine/xanthosine triphosphatase
MRVIVASTNPVKIAATRQAFQAVFGFESVEYHGVTVPSGVSEQPFSDSETLRGALNRTQAAYDSEHNADYWVGIEGGVEPMGNEMTAFAWVVVRSRALIGKGKSGTFFLPESVAQLVNVGVELGIADDRVFGLTNSKQNGGSVGYLTHGVIDRTELYKHATVLALIPFKNIPLYVSMEVKA